jgi:colanic acid/amylovoran biosynthesis glycosyltransferase
MHLPESRVGYVVKRYPRYSETFIVNEILAHEAAGLEIDIFSLYPPNDTHFQDLLARVKASVTYVNVQGLKASDLWSEIRQVNAASLQALAHDDASEVYQALRIARHIRQKGITHLHAHFATSATTVARLAAHLAGIPFSFTAHAKDIFHESVSRHDLEQKLKDAARVITVSDYNLAYLSSHYGFASGKVQRLYNGLDLERFPFYTGPRQPTIVSVGRLVEKKGFEDLIEACYLLKQKGQPVACHIIGSGELGPVLQAQIDRLGLSRQVCLLGPMPQMQVIEKVSEASIFALPCVVGEDGNRDGLPTVLLEAMALGTPCISTDVTGIPEVLIHERTGLQVPQNHPEALAQALMRLLNNPELADVLALQARAQIEASFDIHKNAAVLRRVFEAGVVA